MNLKPLQTFTFGPDPFPINNPPKHPQISKLSPFYQIAKPSTEHKKCRNEKYKKDQNIQRMMQTLQRENKENKENTKQNDYVSLNVPAPRHRRIPTDIQLIRLDTSPNNSFKFEEPQKKNTYRKLSYNGKPISQLKTIEQSDKYKNIVIKDILYCRHLNQEICFKNKGNCMNVRINNNWIYFISNLENYVLNCEQLNNMFKNQQTQKILLIEGKLYSNSIEQQIAALKDIKDELLQEYKQNVQQEGFPNHQHILTMLAKFFSCTGILFLRIKVVDIIQSTFSICASQIQDWKQIIFYFQKELYCNNYQLRIISLHALYHLIPIMKDYQNVFHILMDTFYNCVEEKELYIASISLIKMVKMDYLYQFMNKIQKLPTFEYFKLKKLNIILKCVQIGYCYHSLYSDQTNQKQINKGISTDETKENTSQLNALQQLIFKELTNNQCNRNHLHLFYNYLKLFPNNQNNLIFLQRQDIIKQILSSNKRIKQLFNSIYQTYNKSLILEISQLPLFDQIANQQDVDCTTLNIIEAFIHNYDKTYLYVQQILTSYYKILSLINNLQIIFNFTCQTKLVTVSLQIENQLLTVLSKIDSIIFYIFTNMTIEEISITEIQIKLINLAAQIHQTIDSSDQTTLTKIVQKHLSLQVRFITLKILYNINEKSLIQSLLTKMINLPPYITLYVNYLTHLDENETNLFWNDFQINSPQVIIRNEVLHFYQEFHILLQTIISQNYEWNQEKALSVFGGLNKTLQDLLLLQEKIQFYSNQLFSEDALYFQRIVLEKLILYFSRKYLDIELDHLIQQDSKQIITKLIQFNKIRFIKSFLPNLRSEKLTEFIENMQQSIYHYPKILLQLRECPKLLIDCQLGDIQQQHILFKFIIRITKYISDTELYLQYSINDQKETEVKLQVKENYAILQCFFENNANIKYKSWINYKGKKIMETQEVSYKIN